MPHDITTGRWLILEQESDRPEWGFDATGGGFIVREKGIELGRPGPGHAPLDAEICVLFLLQQANQRLLPDCFKDAVTNGWRVWCHYGGDLHPGQIYTAWSCYTRLTDDERRGLFPAPGSHPQPFSRSQPLHGSEDFTAVKNIIKAHRPSSQPAVTLSNDAWLTLQSRLTQAWEKSAMFTGLQAQVRQVQQALPALLVTKYMQCAIPEKSTDTAAIVDSLIGIYKQSGLGAMSVTKEGYSEKVRASYRTLGHAITRAAKALQVGRKKTEEKRKSEPALVDSSIDLQMNDELLRIRGALETFISDFEAESRRASDGLSANPSRAQFDT